MHMNIQFFGIFSHVLVCISFLKTKLKQMSFG